MPACEVVLRPSCRARPSHRPLTGTARTVATPAAWREAPRWAGHQCPRPAKAVRQRTPAMRGPAGLTLSWGFALHSRCNCFGGRMGTSDKTDRREFLKTGTGLLTGVLLTGAPAAMLLPGRAWALDLKALTSAEGQSLLMMARTIAPHDKLDDAAYAVVVGALDAEAARDPAVLASTAPGLPAWVQASPMPVKHRGSMRCVPSSRRRSSRVFAARRCRTFTQRPWPMRYSASRARRSRRAVT